MSSDIDSTLGARDIDKKIKTVVEKSVLKNVAEVVEAL